MQPQPYNPTGLPPVGGYPQMPQNNQPVTMPSQPSAIKKLLPVLIGVGGILLGIGIGYLLPRTAKAPAPQTRNNASTQTTLTAIDPGVAKLLKDISGQINGGAVEQTKLAPHYQMPGDDYATAAAQKDSFNITVEKNPSQIAANLNVISAYFKSAGFNEAIVATDAALYYAKYTSDQILCGVTRTPASVPSLQDIHITCASKASYSANATAQKPFYTAYAAAKKADPTKTASFPSLLGMPTIVDSRTNGYKTAELTAHNEGAATATIAMFYQTPDKTWRFLTLSSQQPTCSAYATVDAKRAYLGEPCFNDTTKVDDTVKL